MFWSKEIANLAFSIVFMVLAPEGRVLMIFDRKLAQSVRLEEVRTARP